MCTSIINYMESRLIANGLSDQSSNFPSKRAQNSSGNNARARAYTIRELNNTKRLGYMEWIADYYRDIAAVEKSGNWQEEA